MGNDRPNGVSNRRPIVVRDGVAARQWEAYLAADRLARGEAVWLSPPLIPYRAWTEQLLGRQHARAAILSPLQSEALWRLIIADSPAGAALISDRGAAEWAAQAWTLIRNWGVDVGALRSRGVGHDVRAFLGWCDAYRSVLSERHWLDRAEVDAWLAAEDLAVPPHVVLADLGESSPARTAFLGRLEARGCRVESWHLPSTAPSISSGKNAGWTKKAL